MKPDARSTAAELQGVWPFGLVEAVWSIVAFRRWLDPSNFDARGRQLVALGTLTAPILVNRG